MDIFIGSDHRGFEVKEIIKKSDFNFLDKKIKFIDVGTYNNDSCNYPDYAQKLIKLLKEEIPFKKTAKQENFGILICGTGIGMCMVANRFKKIRAAVCRNIEEAKLSRQHNNANVLCLGAKITDINIIHDIIRTFISTDYEGGRHDTRLNKF